MNGIFFDITDRKQAEEELKKYRDHLEEFVEKRTYELIVANQQLREEIEERTRVEEERSRLIEELKGSLAQINNLGGSAHLRLLQENP